MLAELFDWFENEIHMLPAVRTFGGTQMIRVEEYVDDGRYVLRAELPGVSPDKDIDVTFDEGILTLDAERREQKTKAQRSEFHYGAFTRRISLPTGANEDEITAKSANDVFEVRVGTGPKAESVAKRVPITAD